MLFTGSVVVACCWFVGSSVAGCFCLAQVYDFGALGLQLGLFVLSRWFGACCFLLFTSALQGWGPAPTVGAVFFLLLLLLFGCFTVFRPCTHEWTCGCVIFRVWRGRDLFCCKILLILQC
jgi:hypothetical protein